ncbi:MAG: FMN-binding protein, partial [Desulfocapsaceae bacterium]|nr:FMN-binding protein [Desulfocapsaceae bacterium]
AALTSANYLLDPYVNKQTDFYVRGPALERLFGKPAEEVLGDKIVVAAENGEVPVFFMKDDETVSRLAVEAVGKGGYGGDIIIMIGVDLVNGALTGMETVSHSETPGLGARIEEPGFRRQWSGLPVDQPLAITADGGVIDAISGASTTSRAAVNGTNDVLDFVAEKKDEIIKQIEEL